MYERDEKWDVVSRNRTGDAEILECHTTVLPSPVMLHVRRNEREPSGTLGHATNFP